MTEYHKIQTVYLRDPETKFKTLLLGQYAEPEFAYLADNEWVFTEKVDGTNIRVMVSMAGGPITFGGRSDNAQIPAFLIERLQERFLADGGSALRTAFPGGACLYGEGYGARIQKGGGNYRPDADFVLFDVRIGNWWLHRAAVEEVSAKLSLDIVPIVGRGALPALVEMARGGVTSQWGGFAAEGLVARPAIELATRAGKRIITKIKTRDFGTQSRPSSERAAE